MNHIFYGCDMFGFTISSPNIPITADMSGIFENCKIKFITIDSNSIYLRNDFFNGLGSGTDIQPCVIDAPEDFDFGVNTSTDTFQWKGGCFKGYQLEAYVAVESIHSYYESISYFDPPVIINDDYLITFYYDTRKNVRVKNGYSRSGSNPNCDDPNSCAISRGTTTYSLSEWEDNKPDYLFKEAECPFDSWYDNNLTTSIRFDKSFAQYRPKSTRKWFELTRYKGAIFNWYLNKPCTLISGVGTAVTKIEGLEYLNTSETTNTERMFYGLCCLDSLDLSHLDFSKVTNSKDMFGDCYSLNNLNVNSTLNLDQGTDENDNCSYYVLKNDNITFYFDDKINERNGLLIGEYGNLKVVSYNGPNCYLSWNSYSGKHATIDPSFAYRPIGKTIGWFYNNSSLESVQGLEYLHSTDMSGMFYGCSNLQSIDLEKCDMSMTQSTDYMFTNCSELSEITIPNTCKIIGDSAFYSCSALTSVTVLNPTPIYISQNTFSNRKNATLYVPFGSKAAYKAANYWKEFKQIIELPGNIITFADSKTKALCVSKWDTNGDGELSESEAAAVTSLGTTFKKSQISSFNELSYFTGLTSISDGAFSKSTVGAITLPANIASLGKEAFLDCKSLTSIDIPAKVQTLGQNALSGCTAMTTITVDEGNTAFCSVDGVLFSKDKALLVQYPAAKSTTYAVPDGTTTIGRDAFYMSKLKTITLPSTLKELVYDAFGYSKSLEALEIPEGVTTIGDYILDNCTALKSVTIPSTVTSIGGHICNGCNALTDVYCHIMAPFAISKDNFTTTAYNSATLHVPSFAADKYKELEGWKYFLNIVGDLASNILLAGDMTIDLGKSTMLEIGLHNDSDIDGVQFDMTLPEGLGLAKDNNGKFVVTTTDRTRKLTASCTKKGDGWYRFLLFSADRSIIEPGEGAILSVKLECPADATPGDYDMSFTDIFLSCFTGSVSVNQNCDDFTAAVTINEVSTMSGDANGDYEVDINDVMLIVNYILVGSAPDFIFDNADVDGDGIINVTDVMNVVGIILGTPANAPAHAKAMPNDLLRISPTKDGCTLHTTFHTQKVTAMQMTVSLPDGCQLESANLTGEASRTHKAMTRRIDDNHYNVVVFSTSGTTLSVDSQILNLGISGRGGMVNVENILCTNTDFETLLSNDISTVITGITAIIADCNSDAPVYNTQGQRMNKPQRGVNIYEGRKEVVK